MGKVDTITFDKTGTLTFGKLEVSDIVSFSNFSENELLALAASCEAKSEHPLGKGIVEYGKKSKINLIESVDFKMESGKGIVATLPKVENQNFEGGTFICGKEKYFEEKGLSINESVKSKLETVIIWFSELIPAFTFPYQSTTNETVLENCVSFQFL